MRRTRTVSLDTDWLWRVVLCRMAKTGHNGLASVHAALLLRLRDLLPAIRLRGESHFGESAMKKRAGVFARAWSIGTTALWIAVLLTAYVLFYLV